MGELEWSSGPEDVIQSLRASAKSWKDEADRLLEENIMLKKEIEGLRKQFPIKKKPTHPYRSNAWGPTKQE